MKKICLVFMGLLCIVLFTKAELKLTVIGLNGAETQFVISQIGKITFEDGKMYLYDFDNTLLGFNDVESIGQVVVEEKDEGGTHGGGSEPEEPENQGLTNVSSQLRVYAEPELQQLVVVGLPENQMLRVFDTTGRLLMSVPSQSQQTHVDVSSLQKGTYLLQFGAQVVKFVKQ